MTSPLIIGVRHHSPACARLVAARIRERKPAYVLIEGPADFNARIDELYLPHRLPLAIYSYLSSTSAQRGSWSPFAEHSPEWQALVAAREVGARALFIDLPAWHDALGDLPNRYADTADASDEALSEAYASALAEQLGIEGRDSLWDHLFESAAEAGEGADEDLSAHLTQYFEHLRNDDPGSPGNRAREDMMARWIAWAMARKDGAVVVICGGYHAPALARLWTEVAIDGFARDATGLLPPATPQPEGAAGKASGQGPDPQELLRFGSYLVPYSYKRLDAFSGYASGMSSPAWYQWVWELGASGAGACALQQVLGRLRAKKLPASTADFIAVHARAKGLALLRGHRTALRTDWLDAIAGALLKDAQEAALPWSYRGPLRPGTDPILVEVMDVLAGQAAGKLAPGTPQPPLVASVHAQLQALGLSLDGEFNLDLLKPEDRERSRALHRLSLLGLPGVERVQGPRLALSGERRESWKLRSSIEQTAALIEAGAYGASLEDAARARLEEELRAAHGRLDVLTRGLNRAAFAGLSAVAARLLDELRAAIAHEPAFEAIGAALAVLHPLLRHGQLLGTADAPVLCAVIEAAFDRALWLFEAPVVIATAEALAHIRAVASLRDVGQNESVGDHAGDAAILAIEPQRLLAVLARKARDAAADPLSRGAAIGALYTLDSDNSQRELTEALQLLGTLAPARLGDALSGLVALAREALAHEPAFIAGLDALVQALDQDEFVLAMPAIRGAFSWLPPRERGALARQVLRLHKAEHLSQRALTQALALPAETLAQNQLLERRCRERLARFGLGSGA